MHTIFKLLQKQLGEFSSEFKLRLYDKYKNNFKFQNTKSIDLSLIINLNISNT